MTEGQFTPTTEQVRDGYRFDSEVDYYDPVNAGSIAAQNGRAFDRWLAENDAKVKAEAWDEGHEAGVGHGKDIADWQNLEGYGDYDVHPKPQPNPYRGES